MKWNVSIACLLNGGTVSHFLSQCMLEMCNVQCGSAVNIPALSTHSASCVCLSVDMGPLGTYLVIYKILNNCMRSAVAYIQFN